MRRFIANYSRQTGATVLLTSHYMADVETLCKRIVLIDQGRLRYDGDLEGLAIRLTPYKLLQVTLLDNVPARWEDFGEVIDREGSKISLRVHRQAISTVTARLLAGLPVVDLSVTNPPLESVMDQVYREGVA